VLKEKDGSLKRNGLVNFKEAAGAQKAIKEVNGKKMEDGTIMYATKHLSKRELLFQSQNPVSQLV